MNKDVSTPRLVFESCLTAQENGKNARELFMQLLQICDVPI